ncbi:MAG: helix-turn-helix domain-containing protein [Heyndrickxia sp.]
MEEKYKHEIKKFGLRVRKIREGNGLSQLDIEISSGINRTEISRIENGLKNIEFFTIVKLAAALGVEVYQLFEPDNKIV